MKTVFRFLWISFFLVSTSFTGCDTPSNTEEKQVIEEEFIVELPDVSYPLPAVDHINNNGDKVKRRSINDNPVAYLLRGINDIWKGTTDAYQSASSQNGPGISDYEKGNPIIDSVTWKDNIQYVINVTHNRSDEEAILAYLDENRAKYYSVIDGFGPLTEDYVKYSGAYVDLPEIKCSQVLKDTHYHCDYNDHARFAGDENSPLGAVVRLARDFRNNNSSSNGVKYLYSTPRPWRMNDTGAVNFLGTTYDTVNKKPTYSCINHNGEETLKIYDIYESSVKVIPGVVCSRKNHKKIYEDNNPLSNDLYTNTTENRRTDNAYPSGHTNAGFLSALAYAYAFPERFAEMIYRGALLGENRIVAGMHSPVDVIGGKTMALALACAALKDENILNNANRATKTMYDFFKSKSDSMNMSLYDYAHQHVQNTNGYKNGEFVNTQVFNNNFYDNKTQIKKQYRFWLTYGFTQDTTKANLAPIVPKGAEAILKSRFPYLSKHQRRAVLYTTEIPSGYKILDKTNGWGRIDLLAAADGYGSFIGHVNINMDASLGRFNALDTWGNNIDGDGYLTKSGTGKLILTGNNSYSGGTFIKEGTLAANSNLALGNGNVEIEENGTLEINKPLTINGSLTQNGGSIHVNLNNTQTPYLNIEEKLTLKSGALKINFNKDNLPAPKEKIAVIRAAEIIGTPEDIESQDLNITYEINNHILYIIIE